MIKPCSQPLKSNPFTTYRDAITGRWIVITSGNLTHELAKAQTGPVQVLSAKTVQSPRH